MKMTRDEVINAMTQDELVSAASKLTTQEAIIYAANKKDSYIFFVLTFFLGWIGAQWFYMDKKIPGILSLIFFWTLIPCIASIFCLFSTVGLVKNYNAALVLTLSTQSSAVIRESSIPIFS